MSSQLPPPFRIATARVGSTNYITVSGELDIQTAPELYDVLAEESAKGGTLVLDMGGLEFIDSSGIRVLVVACSRSLFLG